MATTFNPQAAADQARNAYRSVTAITQPRSHSQASPWRHATHNPEVVANNARDKKAAMDYLAHAQAAMDARD